MPTGRRPLPMLAAHARRSRASRSGRRSTAAPAHHRRAPSGQPRVPRCASALRALGPRLSAAMLVIDNATGEVLRPCRQRRTTFDSSARAIDMTQAAALAGLGPEAFHLCSRLRERHRPSRDLCSTTGRRAIGVYQPENFDLAFQGTVTARRALQLSLNVPAVELLAELGPARFSPGCSNAGAESRPAEGCGARPRHRPRRARHHADRSDAALCRPRARRRGAAARRALLDGGDPAAGAQPRSPIRSRPGTWSTSCAARRRRTTRSAAASPSRPARPTATAMPGRSASTGAITIGVWVGRPDGGAVPGLIGRAVAAPILFDAFARSAASSSRSPRRRGPLRHDRNPAAAAAPPAPGRAKSSPRPCRRR